MGKDIIKFVFIFFDYFVKITMNCFHNKKVDHLNKEQQQQQQQQKHLFLLLTILTSFWDVIHKLFHKFKSQKIVHLR